MTAPTHPFILSPGDWLGQGKIAFSASKEVLDFYTKWFIPKVESKEKPHDRLEIVQSVEMVGAEEAIENRFVINNITATNFHIRLENELIGVVIGSGVIDKDRVAWEFRGHPNFEGFEVYELQKDGQYLFHAEYVSPDQFRSIIDGKIWKKTK